MEKFQSSTDCCVNSTSNWFTKLLGNYLVKYNDRTKEFETFDTTDILSVDGVQNINNNDSGEHPVIALYFTPLSDEKDVHSRKYINKNINQELIKLYYKINEDYEDGKRLQVVQICFQNRFLEEKSEIFMKEQFEDCLVRVPWFGIPHSNFEKRARLRHQYGVKDGEFGLILLDSLTGDVITKQGYSKILEDSTGADFPWKPPQVLQILRSVSRYLSCKKDIKSTASNGDIEEITDNIMQFYDIDKTAILGIYFSANWCPPCKAFTAQLGKTYRRIKERGQKFEIIFVSSDRSQESFNQYASGMPWLAIPYEDIDCRNQLTTLYDVKGIPTLILLNNNGSIITEDGRGEISNDSNGQNFPWYPKQVNILTDRLSAKLHACPSLVLFIDGEEEGEIELAESVLLPISEYIQKNYEDFSFQFFIAVDSETSERLRDYLHLEDCAPLVTIVDIPIQRFAVMEYGKDITEQAILDFVNNFFQGTLKYTPIYKSR